MPIYIVRHGQTAANVQSIYQGRLDYELTETGRQQASRLGRWLQRQGVTAEVLFSSPLKRAWATAQIISAAAALPAPTAEPLLVEYDAGELSGLTVAQASARWPDYPDRPLEARGDFAEFGGESYDQMQARLREFTTRIHQLYSPEQGVLIVSHGGCIYQLLKHWCGWPTPRHFFTRIGNCCCFKLELRQIAGHQGAELLWFVPRELMAD